MKIQHCFFWPTVILILVVLLYIKYKKWGPKFNLQYKLMTVLTNPLDNEWLVKRLTE